MRKAGLGLFAAALALAAPAAIAQEIVIATAGTLLLGSLERFFR